ncbi:MAG: diaminopimelate epimerase [SAR202 cluster bacterium]|nr:diaminopimelate epimerase [SAR202 cluster bacterium]
MRFTKMHGAGNDYVYVDARGLERDWPQLARVMSDRHFGVGSDGLILVMGSEKADLRMRMFNADGSEGEMCGNGIRCFAKYAIERGIASPGEGGLSVETLAGIRTVAPIYQGKKVSAARVSMGKPRLEPQDLPVSLDPSMGFLRGPVLKYPLRVQDVRLPSSFVSMGNPHAVTFIDQPVREFPLHNVGPLVERHPMFPRRVNFEIVNADRRDHLTARVWERGSGETMACGTGACAIAVAGRLLGLVGDKVDITLPGGTLTIQWDGKGEVILEGPAAEVFEGDWPEA